ncbi:MAG: YihY/virulence factor BrkB family protein [Planctomycetes bacterium]|nr:YihY/virulence factor BrkB family protein [Planctomycetota bacterium]
MQKLRFGWELLSETYQEWRDDRVPRLGAALAYYAIFSIAPLLVIAVALAGAIWGRAAVSDQLAVQLESLVGRQAALAIQEMISGISYSRGGALATYLSLGALAFGASGVVMAIKDAMNTIWGVMEAPGRGWWGTIRDQLISLAVVLSVGFLLLVSLVLTAVLEFLSGYAAQWAPFSVPVAQYVHLAVAMCVITLLFAMIFKLLPDVRIAWRDVWVGAILTAVLFLTGKELIGLYLGRVSTGSAYGAVGSIGIVLLWAYYSSQILLLGAEFTQVYARRTGAQIGPKPGAIRITEALREQETQRQKEGRQKEGIGNRVSGTRNTDS